MRPDERRAALLRSIGDDPGRLTPDHLQRLADGAIMDPCAIYLPAGKISLAEAQAREATQWERLA